ncbi:MAG: right-handed parallel beta-helix repeat-containing protein, partial [Gemmatimonadota bacterium]
TTYTVDATSDGADANTADGVCDDGAGACTLRAAIEQANATAGLDSVHFDVPGAGVHTIQPATLPEITDPVVLDGYTQPGASPNSNDADQGSNAVILIALDASLTNGAGLDLSAGGSTVRGLSIHSAGDWEIRLFTNGNNTVEGNFLGIAAAGDSLPDPGFYTVRVQSSGNTIGGTTPAARNVIEGGASDVRIEAGGDETVVQGNLIGLDSSGAESLRNGTGIEVIDAQGTVIGGTTPAARNVIAGASRGIVVRGTSLNTRIRGNYIGTDVTGTSAVRIGSDGIELASPSSLTTVGGSAAGEGNLIAGTGDPGVRISANENVIQGNVLGLDATGADALPFDYEGIYLDSGASDNLIGGDAPGEGNTVTNAGTQGISLAGGAATTRNTISGNVVFDNPIGIDLGYDGVTPNDADDSDTGPNGLLNFPDLTLAYAGSTAGAVQGSYTGAVGEALNLEFFASGACNPLGYGEGERFLGSGTVTTDASGQGAFTATLTEPPAAGEAVTATATDADGSTSEFSECVIAAGYTVAVTPDTVTISTGQSASYTVSVAATGPEFGEPVSLSCAGALPSGASCTFSPPEVTPGTGTATSTLTVGTATAWQSPVAPVGSWGGSWPMSVLLTVLGVLAMSTMLAGAARGGVRPARAVVVAVVLAATAGVVAGCGDDPSGPSTPTPVVSTFVVNGTSGPIVESDQVVLVVE